MQISKSLFAITLSVGLSACTSTPSQLTTGYQLSGLSSGSSEFSSTLGHSPQEDLKYPEEDLVWMYKTAYGEVRQQSDHEIRAVCQVIYNRLQSGLYGSTFKDVVLSDKQFSVWNRNDRQRKFLLSIQHGDYDDPNYARVMRICNSVLVERTRGYDESRGINYFYHPAGMSPRCTKHKWSGRRHHKHLRCTRWRRLPPAWAYNYEHRERIGAGVFMRKSP